MNGAEKGMPILQVEGLKKSFGKLEVLRGIDEQIREGEAVSIIGPSGGGKSTFLRCLNLLETPTAGKIYFRGADVMDKRHNIDQYRQKIGMVFQNFNVFPHMTALENITLAPMLEKKIPKAEAEEKACALLERVGADRPALRALGQRALEQLYLSWEDSVARAYARYGTVLDHYRRGLSGRSVEWTDELYNLLDDLRRGVDAARHFKETSRRRLQERLRR